MNLFFLLIGFLGFLFETNNGFAAAFQCSPTAQKTERSQVFECKYTSLHSQTEKKFYVFRSKGTYPEISYDHGLLLGKLAEQGPIKESIDLIDFAVNKQIVIAQNVMKSLIQCLTDKLLDSTSKEFADAVDSFIRGYQQGALNLGERNPLFSERDLKTAAVGIELANVMDAVEYGDTAKKSIISSCGLGILGSLPFGILDEAIYLLTFRQLKLGCTGFVVEKNATGGAEKNVMIHARNLDGEMTRSIPNVPAVFLHEEIGMDKKGRPYKKYFAAGAAGLIYPGGISGFNEKGISVSLHQMYPRTANIFVADRQAEIAPYLTQRILREAESVHEALEIAQSVKNFASWTILVMDEKTNETMSIEISDKGARPRNNYTKDESIAQTNHFINVFMSPDVVTPNTNKHLESRARFKTVEDALWNSDNLGKMDRAWAIHQLSNHWDPLAREEQSFGRVAVKAYSVLSTVAIPGKNELWVTGSDFLPAPHSTYLGFQVDWKTMNFTTLGTTRSTVWENTPNYRESLANYLQARQASLTDNYDKSLELIDLAITNAEKDQKKELPYYYMKARVLAYQKKYAEANLVWDNLLSESARTPEYQLALTKMFAAFSIFREAVNKKSVPANSSKIFALVDEAELIFKKYFEARSVVEPGIALFPQHPETKKNLTALRALREILKNSSRDPSDPNPLEEDIKAVEESKPDFVVFL